MQPAGRGIRRIAGALAAALFGAFVLASGTQPAEAACLSPREARQAVASGEAMRLSAIARRVGGDIVNAQLCEARGGLVYRLAVMRRGGRVATLVVDARSGAVLNR
ncbi:PepSY domain-containing protein [Methylobrevis pamukkalensis]|uniref:PepSY domain-containing protein n=1 Tax=Methylobrevis pamukkalensis TaxID=1439726 RepID=A0A1E3H7Y7_9HYPH|nr:hypothetical protein [Methylobrevis pamukkalensis]ODN72447.1 hypothetical protein A6302_00193 [Methylobrevis pamukkalensis]